jgi:hypothetical protein
VITATVLVAVVALAVIVAVAWPLLNPQGTSATAVEMSPSGLQDEIDRALRAIKEIEFDHAAGSLSDGDFAELVGAERARAAELLRRRDSLGG